MKRVLFILLAGIMVFSMTACGGSENNETSENTFSSMQPQAEIPAESEDTEEVSGETSEVQTEPVDGSNVLVAYFSRTGENYNVGVIEKGNTEIVAEMIAEQIGGQLFEISTVTPYPEDYDACTDVARQEQSENARPELAANVENMENYDVVFLGYPIWWSDMPMAVYTFLESYDFSGKTIVPFCTHEGSGLASTASNIAEICPDAQVLDGLAIQGSVAQNSQEETAELVIDWLGQLGYMN